MLFCSGDTHGKVIERFSYRQNPALRQLTADDVIFQLGDFGQPFGINSYKEAKNVFEFLNNKPWITIVIGGNHDDYDYWQSCPQVELFNGKVRQAVINDEFFSIFFVDEITIFNIDNYHILAIPGAESHDTDIILDPNDKYFKQQKRNARKLNYFFRIKGQSWWPQEQMNVQKNAEFMEYHMNEHFDFILTHDAPALINSWFKRSGTLARYNSTAGQLFLEELRKNLDFDVWIHSHFHFDHTWPDKYDNRMCGVYSDILQLSF